MFLLYDSLRERKKMQAVVISSPQKIHCSETERPKPGPDEVLVRVMASGICGTDVHIYRGEYLGDYPVTPGHEFSGVVEKTGSDVAGFRPGDRIAVEPNISCDRCVNCLNNRQNFCLNGQAVGVTRPGAMAQLVTAPEKNVFPIGELSFEQAAFMEPLSCVIHGIQKTGLRMGDRVAVVGSGPIGILLLECARALGASSVTMVDTNGERLTYAEAHKASKTHQSLNDLPEDHFDVVIDATGSPAVMARLPEFVRYGGGLLLFGVAPRGETMEIEPFLVFRKGLTIVSSYTSLRNSWQALDLLQSGQVSVEGLVTHRLALEEMEQGINLITSGKENVMKAMVFPNGDLR
jgi:2-desacetyl-2-hydroxyethyl bacteriochlorophyllide A dehydrogenase